MPQRKGDPIMVTADEGVRADTTAESLSKLRPAFAKDGTITAGSASQISDGAAAVVVMSKAKAQELGLTWLAEIGAHGVVAGPDASLQEQPANAIKKACAREGIAVSDVDLFELNEAFAAVGIVSTRALGVSDDIVNVNGGAIALGHPVGMSGAQARAHARARAEAPRRRHRCRRAVRRRRAGRRPAHPRPAGVGRRDPTVSRDVPTLVAGARSRSRARHRTADLARRGRLARGAAR